MCPAELLLLLLLRAHPLPSPRFPMPCVLGTPQEATVIQAAAVACYGMIHAGGCVCLPGVLGQSLGVEGPGVGFELALRGTRAAAGTAGRLGTAA